MEDEKFDQCNCRNKKRPTKNKDRIGASTQRIGRNAINKADGV